MRALALAWVIVLGAVAGLVVYAGLVGDPPPAPMIASAPIRLDLPPRPAAEGPRAARAPLESPAPPAPAAASRGGDAAAAWVRFGRRFDANDPRPRLAIIVVGLGLNATVTEAAIRRLPGEVTLAFSPYADDLERWVALARSIGHEILMQVPMESANLSIADPGPQALSTSLTPAQNLERLDWTLRRASGFVGVMPHLGERFVESEPALRPMLEAFKSRGLLLLDPRSTQRSRMAQIAGEMGLPRVSADGAVDETLSREAIEARLGDLVAQARRNGVAVATVAPTLNAVDRVTQWLPTAESRGVVIAPISAALARQAAR